MLCELVRERAARRRDPRFTEQLVDAEERGDEHAITNLAKQLFTGMPFGGGQIGNTCGQIHPADDTEAQRATRREDARALVAA